MLESGDRMPSIKLADDTGETVSTPDLLGPAPVVYFYPEDDTPG